MHRFDDAVMASSSIRASPIRLWAIRIAAALSTGVLATPLAGAIGGAVLYLALLQTQPGATVLLLLTFVFYGAIFGALLAWPVTLLCLPVCTVLLHARRSLSRWLLPLIGLLAGAMRFIGEFPDMLDPVAYDGVPDARHAMVVSGAAGGLLAGFLFAWIPSACCPRAFLPKPRAHRCATPS